MPILVFAVSGCDDDEAENMVWEVVSNSDPAWIEIVNETTDKFDSPSQLWVKAGYKSGDVVLRCKNHPIDFSSIGPGGSYTNEDMGFTLSEVDTNTLNIHFAENASGASETTDQIAITNADLVPAVCNTFLFIIRSFGELQPDN